MKNKYKVREQAAKAGIPLTKWISAGTTRIEVERPVHELVEELEKRGLL